MTFRVSAVWPWSLKLEAGSDMHALLDSTTGGLLAGLVSPLASALSGVETASANLSFWRKAWFGTRAASGDARMADDTYMYLWWLCVFWFVLLMALMFWFCVKWRRKPGVAAPRSPSHHTVLEITWTIIPTLFFVAIFFKGFWDYVERIVARGDSTMIALEAQKWNWDMVYANGRVTTELTSLGGRLGEVKIFYVPDASGIQLRMTSKDVIHSFWVPDWRIKCDIFPNRYTSVWFETDPIDPSDPDILVHEDEDPDSVGQAFEERYLYKDHLVYCAEYCGDYHSEMIGIVRVVPRDVYAAWVNDPGIDWDDALPGGRMPLWQIGQLLHATKGCSSCHTVNGAAGTGPTWDNAWGKMTPLSDGSQVLYDENYVRSSIYSPGVQLHQGYANQMTVFTPDQINERELGAIMSYMMYLADIEMDPAAVTSIIGGGAATTTPPAGAETPQPAPEAAPQPAPAVAPPH